MKKTGKRERVRERGKESSEEAREKEKVQKIHKQKMEDLSPCIEVTCPRN